MPNQYAEDVANLHDAVILIFEELVQPNIEVTIILPNRARDLIYGWAPVNKHVANLKLA